MHVSPSRPLVVENFQETVISSGWPWPWRFGERSVHSTAIFAYFSNTGGYERRCQHLLQVSLQAECLPADPARQGDIHKVDTLANILFLKICFSRPSPDTWISRYRDQSLGFLLTLAATGRKVQVCKVYMTIFLLFWMIRMQWTLFFQVFCSSMDTMDKACKCKFSQISWPSLFLGGGGPNEVQTN